MATMMVYIGLYISAIIFTILIHVFASKKANRNYIAYGIHLGLTVPSSYFLMKELSKGAGVSSQFFVLLLGTLFLSAIALILASMIFKRVKEF